jgi:hypothetical protein
MFIMVIRTKNPDRMLICAFVYCSISVPVVNYSLEFIATVEALTETTD